MEIRHIYEIEISTTGNKITYPKAIVNQLIDVSVLTKKKATHCSCIVLSYGFAQLFVHCFLASLLTHVAVAQLCTMITLDI